ncbi:MAG: PEP-CTERM sorting domain-containing protein [Phycisphaerae bacterium]
MRQREARDSCRAFLASVGRSRPQRTRRREHFGEVLPQPDSPDVLRCRLGQPSAGAVPDPGTVAILALAGGAMLRRRRR